MPSDAPLPAADRAASAAMADLLDQGRPIHLLSVALCTGAMVALLLAPDPRSAIGPATILLAGLAETWVTIRVGFDARCFRRIADPDGPGLAGFDAALGRLGLMPDGKAGRPLAPRLAGAGRLLRLQGVILIAQVAMALLATLMRWA